MGRVARPVVVALGSNLGSRETHLQHAVRRLHGLLAGLRVSGPVETAPVGTPDPQGPYLNAVAVGVSSRSPRDLLAHLQRIEAECGRTRPYRYAPRTLDLDLILCGDEVVEEPDLQVPHPRFRERAFVLEPLCELAPSLRDPITGLTAEQLLERLRGTAVPGRGSADDTG